MYSFYTDRPYGFDIRTYAGRVLFSKRKYKRSKVCTTWFCVTAEKLLELATVCSVKELELLSANIGTFKGTGTFKCKYLYLKMFLNSYEKCGQRIADKIAENFSSACLVVVSIVICFIFQYAFIFAHNFIIKLSISVVFT